MTSAILLCALPVKAAPAPAVPDAGQTIRGLQQQPELSVPKSTPPLQLLPASAPAPTSASELVPVTKPVSTAKPLSGTVLWKALLENKPVSIEYTNFVPGTIRLKSEAVIELDAVAGFARKYPDAKLEIIGYSDSKASPLLSLGLADSVTNYLVTKGVSRNRITVKDGGSAHPVSDNQTGEGRVKNRRVEIRSLINKEKKGGMEVPAPVPVAIPEEAGASKSQPNVEVRMLVKSIHITGNSAIATAELDALLAKLVGRELTLAELNQGAARITAYYRERGFIVSRAYIPPQEIRDGAVMISVQEGRIGKGRINNLSRLSDQRAHEYLSMFMTGDVLQAAPVERALLLLNETPGVGAARATLQPGASVGSADLVVELSTSGHYSANIQMDNYGNYYTGENRLGAELALNSPRMIGDQVTLRAMVTNQDLTYGYVAYQIPVGGSGLRVGGSYSGTRYRLGKELASLQSRGTATIGSLFTVYPFIRSQKGNLSGTLSLENKQLKDVFVTVPIEKQVQLATFGLTGNRQDAFGGGGATLFDLSIATGRLSMDEVSLSIDKLLSQTNGSFTRLDYKLNRLQRLSDRDSLWLALSGQYASKNLNSSEQFSLGGAYGVRAYPQGEAFGDEGRLATLELRHSFTQKLQGVMFFDAGSVIINHDPYLAGSNTRFLSGGGAGVNAKIFGIDIKASLAVRGSGGQPASEPVTVNHKSRLWVQLGRYF